MKWRVASGISPDFRKQGMKLDVTSGIRPNLLKATVQNAVFGVTPTVKLKALDRGPKL